MAMEADADPDSWRSYAKFHTIKGAAAMMILYGSKLTTEDVTSSENEGA